jgi:hypothetical protein
MSVHSKNDLLSINHSPAGLTLPGGTCCAHRVGSVPLPRPCRFHEWITQPLSFSSISSTTHSLVHLDGVRLGYHNPLGSCVTQTLSGFRAHVAFSCCPRSTSSERYCTPSPQFGIVFLEFLIDPDAAVVPRRWVSHARRSHAELAAALPRSTFLSDSTSPFPDITIRGALGIHFQIYLYCFVAVKRLQRLFSQVLSSRICTLEYDAYRGPICHLGHETRHYFRGPFMDQTEYPKQALVLADSSQLLDHVIVVVFSNTAPQSLVRYSPRFSSPHPKYIAPWPLKNRTTSPHGRVPSQAIRRTLAVRQVIA